MLVKRRLLTRRGIPAAVIGLLLAAALGCALTGQPSESGAAPAKDTPTSAPASTDTPVPTEASAPTATSTPTSTLSSGIEGIVGAKASGVGYTGTGNLTVDVSNPGNEPIDVTLPPGYIFLPPEGSDQQRLMVIKGESITLQPGESGTLDPYVVCIDSDAHAPEGGTDYVAGGLVEDEQLLALAQCLSEQDIEGPSGGAMPNFGLQFAVWSVSSGDSYDDIQNLIENADEAPGDVPQVLDLETIQQLQQLGPLFEQMFGGSDQYLEACGISTGG
jgi:hypothetical protein